ncbi:WcbI family polysaccharide biosynthesis putative acetyltransferase [Pantoea ananatis]|uniref:WcbI family polysaccharide biosynthesis putative acetyltransferase n=1 Tax=Pantoea ananas TaxID=553 RepID=UPI001B317375|nr:WcbI family polysaccharide biosynthesis putative acetyltransferase [Pantoea ananatis]MCW0309030.1 hypothetical protein [Pantoea ananatis]MCW0341053.1 hypothetical protein [Pantoea ananatis]MCW0359422.1 hypothetical protein [Pantoea ananatis]MCW0363896.1 hypothetical protein [Pantoea ananatis]MCW1776386.1 WcbI family polysaccharide biosynthesis putative acetyltransferase [Pantoea ananatis]
MKVATIGNCQLEVVGQLLSNYSELHRGAITQVFNTPLYKLDAQRDIINLMHELESCDHIYMQYHSERWGLLSTAKLTEYFDIRILPTMESSVSAPQLGYYSAAVPDLMVYVDYRFLHLYLTAHACMDAVAAYHNVSYDAARQHNMIMDDANRYQRLFKEGKVAFDYSDFYRDALLKDKRCYSTVSHPNNKHLSIFFSAIFFDLFKENKNFDLGGNDLLKNYIVPEVGSGEQHYFMMRETGLSLACKINYHFFSSQSREQLSEALLRSTYYRSLKSGYQNL